MGRKKKIATIEEILETLTEIMRSSPENGVKISEIMSAAEKLHKYLKETEDEDNERKNEYHNTVTPCPDGQRSRRYSGTERMVRYVFYAS